MLNLKYEFAVKSMPLVIWPGYICFALEVDECKIHTMRISAS